MTKNGKFEMQRKLHQANYNRNTIANQQIPHHIKTLKDALNKPGVATQIHSLHAKALQDHLISLDVKQIHSLHARALRDHLVSLDVKQIHSLHAKALRDHLKPLAVLPQIDSLHARASQGVLERIRSLQANPFQSHDLKLLANVGSQQVSALQTVHGEFSQSWTNLFGSLAEDLTRITRLPPKVVPLPSVELYNSNRVLEVFSDEHAAPELQEEYQYVADEGTQVPEDSLEFLLSELDPGLIRMWRGIEDALTSESEDKVRHFFASGRELFTHVVHKLAPDDEVKEWTGDPNHFHENRPKRKTRMLYICRAIDNKHFSNFVDKDISAVMALSDLFQGGVHSITTDITPGQMSALKVRIEGALLFILETARAKSS